MNTVVLRGSCCPHKYYWRRKDLRFQPSVITSPLQAGGRKLIILLNGLTMNYADKVEKNASAEASVGSVIIINCALNATLMLISIFGNSLVLAGVIRTPSIHSPSMNFLCSLAVSDLLVGLLVQPLYIANTLTDIHVLKLLTGMMAFFCLWRIFRYSHRHQCGSVNSTSFSLEIP